jgi:2-amino-4-hydroxy-6-hydroxymethyldihydropteridine diphosphokinase
MPSSYIIAIGSNRRHYRYGAPHKVVAAAIDLLDPVAVSSIMINRPIGPSKRAYANGAILIENDLPPLQLLAHLKSIEQSFGRRARGQRWSARVLDLDIILWSGGIWADRQLTIPHPAYRIRDFVLRPITDIAGQWRDPVTHFSVAQHKARLDRKDAHL